MNIEERFKKEFVLVNKFGDCKYWKEGLRPLSRFFPDKILAFIKKEQEDLVREMVGEEANTTKRCEPKDRRDCEIADGAYNYKRQQIIDIAKSKGITI